MKKLARSLFLSAALVAVPAIAQQTQEHASHEASATSDAALTEGEVRKVDKDAGKITIRHSAITNLDMPPMTMVFRVQHASMLDSVKAGDKIRFAADKTSGVFIATRIEPAQ